MEWREANGVEWLEARLPGAVSVFSTRSSGSVTESYQSLAIALGIPLDRVATCHQVHGAELAVHDSPPADTPEADGHVITAPGLAGLVCVADCLPVALVGPGGVAMLHCGWRGLAAGIVARGAAAVDATDAAIGPGIGPCCYEVGDEVLGVFSGLGEGVIVDRMLDLAAVAKQHLLEAGVEQVQVAGLCTSCEEGRFFSRRRHGADTGRQAGLAWLVDSEAAAD